ncbi:MAG: ribosome silencing factor [Holosporales bacterium]
MMTPQHEETTGNSHHLSNDPHEDLGKRIYRFLDAHKFHDLVLLDLKGKTSLADAMIIASGLSQRHIRTMGEKLQHELKMQGIVAQVEGLPNSDWILVDAKDVIVHLFRPEVREFYNLEKMWSHAIKELEDTKPSKAQNPSPKA